jgi:hypothetical protein
MNNGGQVRTDVISRTKWDAVTVANSKLYSKWPAQSAMIVFLKSIGSAMSRNGSAASPVPRIVTVPLPNMRPRTVRWWIIGESQFKA